MAELVWKPNKGRRPDGCSRVRVKLRFSGEQPKYDEQWNPMAKPGWAVDTTRWSLTGGPFDVIEYAVIY